jgi:hypothetical protein
MLALLPFMVRFMRKLTLLLVTALVALAAIPAAFAGSGLVVGVNDDTLKWSDAPLQALTPMNDLGLRSVRVSLQWKLGETQPTASDVFDLTRYFKNAGSQSVLLNVYNVGGQSPVSDIDRAGFCQFVNSTLTLFPQIQSVNVGNEVNKSFYFRPQFNADGSSAAPALYVQLLAACYPLIKASHPSVQVVSSLSPRGNDDPNASSNISHSPIKFIAEMGKAYKGMALSGRIFDQFGQNVYSANSDERPWKSHPNNTDVAQGDYSKLMTALQGAFSGTGQPVPGTQGVTIWYLETGFQTTASADKASLYTGTETDSKALAPYVGGTDTFASDPNSPALDQATQLADSLRLAYCQPAVGALYNFELADESNLYGWQSGLLYADYSTKPGYDQVKAAIAEVNSGSVNCSALKGGSATKAPVNTTKPAVKPVTKKAPTKKVTKKVTKKAPAKKVAKKAPAKKVAKKH